MASAFPGITKNLPHWQAAVVLALTRLVGMQCPGLHSLYSELKFEFDQGVTESELRYKTTRLDKRSQQIALKFTASCTRGTILAFIRPKPIIQPKFTELRNLIQLDEFSGQKALVIGGSRGLGEIAVKILATGSVMPSAYDVLNRPEKLVFQSERDWIPTHLYCFATPFIFSVIRGGLSKACFNASL